MSTDSFYSDLPPQEGICSLIADSDSFIPMPPDWYIIITDVAGSTKAIEAGRYKDVNILGACSITSILNIAGDLEIPFIFGGDGASLAIPPSLLSKAKQVLLATKQFACQQFDIDLRVGVVPVAVVMAATYAVKVAKSKMTDQYNQALFTGGGLAHAESLIKNTSTSHLYNLENPASAEDADFSGLICPWKNIPSEQGQIISLIVKATGKSSTDNHQIYRYFLAQLDKIYASNQKPNPILAENLAITFSSRDLSSTAKVRASSRRHWFWQHWHLWKLKARNLMYWAFIKLKIKLAGLDFAQLKKIVAADADYIKFDDTLRMVVAADTEQIEKLKTYLESQYQQGKLVYGIQVSNSALMTCLVSEKYGRHVGFIDGADGGYALAAKEMKERIKLRAAKKAISDSVAERSAKSETACSNGFR